MLSMYFFSPTRGSLESGLEALLAGAGDSLRSLRVVDCSHVLTDRWGTYRL